MAVIGGGSGGISPKNSKDWELGSNLIDVNGDAYAKPHFYNQGDVGSYKFYMRNSTGLKPREVFKDRSKGYKIKLKLSIGFYKPNKSNSFPKSGEVTIEFKVGRLPLITKTFKTSNYDEITELNFYYQPTDFDLKDLTGRQFWFRKVGAGTVKLIDSELKEGTFEYEPTLNNQILNRSFFTDIRIPHTLKLNPLTEVLDFIGNKNGTLTSIKFGNGVFKSGVWKTGVWNDGRRAVWEFDQDGNPVEDDIYYFEKINLNTYEMSKNLWYLKIDANTNIQNLTNIRNNLKVNDYITLGNVVGININEDRYLLKDSYRITNIEDSDQDLFYTITLEIPVGSFPLRRFEVDSDLHLIYVTKNIWLGGTFLNGYFRGVWNYGLFKGFPHTTVMTHSHFISGKFDGGRFNSSINTITNNNSITKQYHTGLIQNFEFYDNNISETESYLTYIDNTYKSWIDVNYYTQSYVNLNSLTSVYDEDFKKIVPFPNLYGYPTKDVMSSFSKFKNSSDSNIEYYNLGTKFKIYTDYLGQNGYFTKAFNSEGKPGMAAFYDAGWTIDQGPFYDSPTASFVYNSNIVRKNFNQFTMVLATFGYNVLNNTNITIPDRRYSVVEYYLDFFTRGVDTSGNPSNTFQKPINLLGSNYNSYFNEFRNGITKTEYFYNKNALDLTLRFNSQYFPTFEPLWMYGFNYTHSISPNGESNSSYSTTYSLIAPGSASAYSDFIYEWEEGTPYSKGQLARKPSFGGDASGHYIISLTDSNILGYTDSTAWARTMVGYYNKEDFKETGINDQSDAYVGFTSVRIPYFKFLEIDSLPFFNYFQFEINFASTVKEQGLLTLIFTKPHGFKSGDEVKLKLDETKFNPQYEGTWTVESNGVVDGLVTAGRTKGDTEYKLRLNCAYGATVSSLSETGTLTKTSGDRIDQRIQTNFYADSPIIQGLDENFNYLGNNQIIVDRTIIESTRTS